MDFTAHFLEEKDYRNFNTFVESHLFGTVHQLCEWGEFQIQTPGRDKWWALAIKNKKGEIKSGALIIRQKLPFGKSWLYSPRGPLLDVNNSESNHLLFKKIHELALQQKALYFRFDPGIPVESADKYYDFFSVLKSKPAHAHYQPESTLLIDLQPSLEEILSQMKPKGRYNIKVAQRHGVVVTESDDIKSFYNLFKETTLRDGFSGHASDYYQNIMKFLNNSPTTSLRTKLYTAIFNDVMLAAAIVTYFKDTATYYFGASSNQHRQVMAPYLLHWKIMEEAKHQGYSFYDLFGIAPSNKLNHPWAGVTQFKEKFGGNKIDYIDAQEIVYNSLWYSGMKIAKKFL